MNPGRPPAGVLARRVAVVLAAPLAVWLGAAVFAWLAVTGAGSSAETNLRAAAEVVRARFAELLAESSRVVARATSESPAAAYRHALRGTWGERVEGVGVIAPDGTLESWEGSPTIPPGVAEGLERYIVSIEGLRTRLTVTAPPDVDGRSGTLSVVLDSTLGDLTAQDLFGSRLARGCSVVVELLDSTIPHEDLAEFFGEGEGVFRSAEVPNLYLPLRSPAGEVLALVTLYRQPAAHRAQRMHSIGVALAAALFAIFLGALFDWSAISRSPHGFLAALAAVAIGRGALLWSRAPAYLLPRELGSPSVYGAARALGLLGSPGDLLLTALAVLLAAYAVRARCREIRARPAAFALASGAAVLCTSAGVAVSVSLARHGAVAADLFEGFAHPLGHGVLLAALAVLLIAAAEASGVALSVLPFGATGRRERDPRATPSRLAVGLALLPLTALSSYAFLGTLDRIDVERLGSEYAPGVLDQATRREIALASSVTEAAASPAAVDAVAAPEGRPRPYAAYGLWAGSDLFHLGYKSSLDLYDARGARVSHFGFDLPPLEEVPGEGSDEVRDEIFYPSPAVPKRVRHADAPIVQNGNVLGTVVGHVLDEPENLPFLPAHAPYLAALGPGTRPSSGRIPDYVLYGSDGRVLLTTVHEPPASRPEFHAAAGAETLLRVRAGERRFSAVAVADGDGERTHLLLLPVRSVLDRLAVFSKLLLLAVALFATMSVIRKAIRDRGVGFMVRGVRESFYHKLLATLLTASLLPLVVLALFLGGYFEASVSEQLSQSAAQTLEVVRRVVEDYAAVQAGDDDSGTRLDDEILYWLRGVVGQEIHLYRDGLLEASSKRELFASGLLPSRLPGEAQRRVWGEGLPYVVLPMRLGAMVVPVAYGRLDAAGAGDGLIAAVPLVLEQQQIRRSAEHVEEMLILTTVLLAVLVIVATSVVAGTVARPVRELVDATGRIAAGDYSARLETTSSDEVARLVQEFNSMAEALAAQRADLERRRDYMQAVLTHATTGVLSTNAAGTVVTVNPAAERLLAVGAPAPAIGDDLVAVVSRNPKLGPLARLLRNPAPHGEPSEIDLEIDGKAVRLRCVRVDLPTPYGDAPGALVLLDDVTDLMRSNQLAAWAEMARAIAHEIKNPLTPIQLSTEHLRRLLEDRRLLPSRDLEACLENVLKQVRALRHIASEFAAYSKLPSLSPELTDPAELMREVVSPYRSSPPRAIAVSERYDEVPGIQADRRVLGRAIVNLIENALQAMTAGGTLSVGTASDDDGSVAVLFVGDTGPGLAPEVRARLFEPYFSTKSSGTGLGLAIVRSTVEAHGGRVDIESSPQRGTVFRIRIPGARVEPTVYSARGTRRRDGSA